MLIPFMLANHVTVIIVMGRIVATIGNSLSQTTGYAGGKCLFKEKL
jgi:hypothetical protein